MLEEIKSLIIDLEHKSLQIGYLKSEIENARYLSQKDKEGKQRAYQSLLHEVNVIKRRLFE